MKNPYYEPLDERFFKEHPDRDYRIREPAGSAVEGDPPEFDAQFRSLGNHDVSRRRIIVKRMDRLKARMFGLKYMPIPFLLFADESISDNDTTLRPIFDGIMRDAAASRGM